MAFSGKAGFIGAGKMGASLIEGIVKGGLLAADKVLVSDIDGAKVEALAKELGVVPSDSPGATVGGADVVFIAVKPDQIAGIAAELKAAWPERKPVFVSIMAGVKTARIKDLIDVPAAVIRVMPNVACLIAQGVTGVAADKAAAREINEFVFNVFEKLGGAVWVAEEKLDAVTAVSGSGPAYVFMFIEALTDAGVKLGLDRKTAGRLAVRTVAGAALMAEQSDVDTLELRARVSSPGGTTVAATSKLETLGFRGAVIEAVEAAYKRSVELSK